MKYQICTENINGGCYVSHSGQMAEVYLTYQCGPGNQILPTSPSLYLLQGLAGKSHLLP